jgi:hypothetical protein
VKFVVKHFQGRIRYYALWNEQDITYWNPLGNPEEYGHLLKAFVPAVHETDPQAKVIYGGLADPSSSFARRSLDVCQCASGIDVFAYHTYPGYGQNLNPESMDYGAYGDESPAKLRDTVRNYPGIRKDLPFWDDEFNSIPSWAGSDESVQAKYVPRGLIYNWAAGVKTFVWLLVAGTDGNEYDDFGIIHGLRNLPDDFTARPVFSSFQNVNALFSDTRPDPSIEVVPPDIPALRRKSAYPFFGYGFRSKAGKPIVAYWLGAHSIPGNVFAPLYADLAVRNSGIRHPALIDVVSGEVSALAWKPGTTDVLANMPMRDTVLAITDDDYIDWPVLPEAPSSLTASRSSGSGSVRLSWEMHGGEASDCVIERRAGQNGAWSRIATQATGKRDYVDEHIPSDTCYRVRAANASGVSGSSNTVRLKGPAQR